MGQKVNPNIFRLGVNKTWESEFFEKNNKEFIYLSYIDLEIKSYIEKFLNNHGLLLHDIKLHYNNSKMNILISYALSSNIKFYNSNSLNKKHTIIKRTNKQKVLFSLNSYKENNIRRIVRQHSCKNSNIVSNYYNPFFNKEEIYSIKQLLTKNQPLLKNKLSVEKNNTFSLYDSLKSNEPFVNYINFKTVELEAYINKFIEGLALFKNNNSNIVVNFQCINKRLNLTFKQKKSLKKSLLFIQKFKSEIFFNEGVNILFLTIYQQKTARLLSTFIMMTFKNIKRHKRFIAFLQKTLTLFLKLSFSNVTGVRIKIKGRLNGAPRAKHKIIDVGSIPIQTIDSNIDYSESTVHASNGTYGIKVWVVGKVDLYK